MTPHSALPRLLALVLLLAASATPCASGEAAGVRPAAGDAAAILRRYVEATGGNAATERSTYTRSRVVAFGFEGKVESWSVEPDRHYSRTALGPFTLAEGTDGAVSWRTDPTTGRVVRLSDRDSLEARIATWFELERWSEPGMGGGSADVAGHERDSTGTYTVLAVSAPARADRKPWRLWFDDASGLLARMETPRDEAWVVTSVSDWRRAAGRLRPFHSTTSISSLPGNRMSSDVDSIAVNVEVAGLPFSPPESSGASAPRWLGSAGVAVLPFAYHARHVWLRASIDGGPPEDFLFDTGASVTVLDSTYAARHGIHTEGSMQAAGAASAGSASFATLASLTLSDSAAGGVQMSNVKTAVLSVNPAFSRYFWRDMAGIIGYDVISRFVVTIDYDRGLLTLRDPRAFHYEGREAPLDMVLANVVPAVHAKLDDRDEGLFRLDVGSSSTVDLHAPFGRQHGIESRLRGRREVSGQGFGGAFSTTIGRLHKMSIGPYAWNEPMVSVSHATQGAFASEDFAGNIGNRVLERFRLTLDYEHRKIWLEPGAHFKQRDGFSRAGTLLGWYGDHVTVDSVLPGSPADKAGLREGDPVVSIDGRPPLQWRQADLDALFERGAEGRRVAIEVDRDGKRQTLTLTLREMLR